MNISTILKEELERFDEKFGVLDPKSSPGNPYSKSVSAGCDDCGGNIETRKEHRVFIISLTKRIIESEIESLETLFIGLPKGKCLNAEMHLFGSCFQCEKIKSHNDCLTDIISHLQEELKLIEL